MEPEWGGGAKPEMPLQPMEVHGGAEICLQPVEEPMLEQWVYVASVMKVNEKLQGKYKILDAQTLCTQ
ncbi:hypothetical protein DUI87_15670 [Hirundo rustica rustica]|uniref:Uncharacterized protein n=1 Tax=Hirundo rustica rustica TaxID=333673 RepID=A0A3M0JZ71_HIRRU|nr:hypothetical protein DUI87_15670 [Hirundo rustica rustica]